MKYKIEFHTDWHCGSGLAAGADVDALVVKDENGLPFIPGKTIKGLVREAMEDLMSFAKIDSVDEKSSYIKAFGFFDDNEKKERGSVFFKNAELSKEERDAIVANKASRFMYRSISSTAIGNDGTAVDHSLRKMEVVVPCVLHGEIIGIEDNDLAEEIVKSLKYIKRLGQNRNRGLGRCTITMED